MKVTKTKIEGCFVIEPKVFEDERGYFFESFNQEKFELLTGAKPFFVQDNQSKSVRGVLRGLHFQTGQYAQAKLVQVLQGEVMDVAVDLRNGSKSFGQVVTHILSSENRKQMYIPRGCAHGFITLSEKAIFSYKCDNFYNKEAEGGIIYNDSTFGIDWLLEDHELILSEKDLQLPAYSESTLV
ncbi:dTDP-4-dehydrorhamnose 3,5-epimerase [Aureicoccus marinus]|jgi:dTDP-4-dehydrorhamnose 3,5-epimerase|uniref:dTDP-4-dehydrorhamnose 3,5-epimerase n=1 Tax=Aureicoccus marinus TaxID=754435 RepID=A0A2S7T7K0_9FLAO|nr:dTDP-4-dehydrorhamnose 3,5-epimerase [Aureicoccus marinus]PQJ15900.1 dTDP-4-dehydrorhamnose 3,5-epimerase [Aureicoccus marinus]